MPNVTIMNGRYTIDDPLYQWDSSKILEIRGLSLASVPEIHFTISGMDRAIVVQSNMDAAGVITAKVPNSLLQKSGIMTAFVCIYSGNTFETLYKIDIPVKARSKPNDYSFVDNTGEVYSFNALENRINDTLIKLNAFEELADVALSGDYEDLKNTPKKVSEFENDKKYIVEESISEWAKDENKPIYHISEIQGLDEYLLNKEHPIGSLYWSKYPTDPAELFGGKWERITDTFILAAGDTYAPDTEGGEAEHVLTVDEIPKHNHVTIAYNTGASEITLTDGYNVLNTSAITNKLAGNKVGQGLSGTSRLVGGDQAHNNMPPYKTRYCWERIA